MLHTVIENENVLATGQTKKELSIEQVSSFVINFDMKLPVLNSRPGSFT